MRRTILLFLTVLCLSSFVSNAHPGKVRLPKMISDCMVLQRDVELDIWGWADPGTWVTDGANTFQEVIKKHT